MGELGSLLVRAREARGLTIEDAERDTRISRRYLAALEAEDFEVIPAPVYARGFLRSYSQYLGLDAQETLDLFPRDQDAPGTQPRRPTMREPVSAVGASRPAWSREPARPGVARPPSGRPVQRSHRAEQPAEPTIGVGERNREQRPRRQRKLAPPPNRRIRTDPGANARSATVALVAILAVVAMIGVAFFISRLGDDANPTPGSSTDITPVPRNVTPTATIQGGGAPTAVPNLSGLTVEQARQALKEAGFAVTEKSEANPLPKGTVIDQSPGPGVAHPRGDPVIVLVSSGPAR